MRKFLVIVTALVLTACGSSPKDPYERRAYEDQKQREAATNRALDQAPKWMIELPTSSNAVYANGSAVSGDFSMADNKAKMVAYSKICMAAGGRVDQRSRMFIQDSGDSTVENSETAIRSMCPGVDITGVETREVKRVSENGRYRTYVLVALPMGEANRLQQRKDQIRLREQAAQRGDRAFLEMEQNKAQ
jgi:hypothetical protein